MKTLNINVITPTENQINEMVELFNSMAEAVAGWDEKTNESVVDLLVDVESKAFKASLEWDAAIPDMEIYSTVTSGLSAAFSVEENVAVISTMVKPEWYDMVTSIIPKTYIDHGVMVLDPENTTIKTRFSNTTTDLFNDTKNGVEFNLIKVA